MLENECEITSLQVPAETEERISKKKAVALFDDGTCPGSHGRAGVCFSQIHIIQDSG